jgi:hypothetical protein
MDLTPKDLKFLTILNETRLADGKMFGRYFEEVREKFQFSNSELDAAVKKLVKLEMLSVIPIGGNERVYFRTEKASSFPLDKDLLAIKH